MTIQDTIHGLFEEQVKKIPGNIAATYEDQSIHYVELNEKANQMAHYLCEIGVQPTSQVAICLERSIDLLIILLGILKTGATYVPLDPAHPETRLLFILNDNNNPLLIVKSNSKLKFTAYQGNLMVLDDDKQKISKQPTHPLNLVVTPEQVAYIIYTSGSTGKPKGVLIEHRSVVNYGKWLADYCCCQPQNRIDFSSNYIFDMAVTTSIVPLMLGLTIVICQDEIKKETRHFINHLDQNNINIVKITPSYFKVLLQEVTNNYLPLPHLTSIILGGENLPTIDCAAWLDIYPEHILFNEYGPTETTVAVSQYQVCHASLSNLGSSVPIGKMGPNMDGYILNNDNSLVLEGEIGELHIGGVCLARGYLNQPEFTEKKFIKHFFINDNNARLYKTGDLCRQLPDGGLEYMGRIDHQLKIRGFRVEPGEIEKSLATHPAIQDVVVLAQKDDHDEKLIAYYIGNDTHRPPNVNQLHQYLKAYLPDYMIPMAFVRVNAFPLTANGKLDRHALPIPRFTTNQHYLAPSTPLEKILADIWSEELGLKLVGIEDNFFELGGHSLSAARIISKINNTLEKDITLRELYKYPTIKKLIIIISSSRKRDKKVKVSMPTAPNDQSLLPLNDFQLLLWLTDTFEPKAKKLNIISRKRMKGQLDIPALTFAFKAVLKKHEILFSHVLKFRPVHRLQKSLHFELIEKNIESLSQQESEFMLETSMKELTQHYPWRKETPMLIAKLFHMKNKETELQICLPHIISDDVTPDILFSDLSTYYLLYNDLSTIDSVVIDQRYKDYQYNEKHYSQDRINRDIIFWENYLSDANLLSFPSEHVIKNMVMTGTPYSTYSKISEQGLYKLRQFCAKNCVSIHDGLCAVLGLALVNCCDGFTDKTQYFFMNIVKSTRDNHHDETIGCFLKLEPIKIGLSTQANLIDLSKQIHESTINTAPYQWCSSLIKIASIGTLRQKKNSIKKYLVRTIIYLYTTLFPTPNVDRQTLNLTERIITTERINKFTININVHKNFMHGLKKDHATELFGLKPKKIKSQPYDLLKIDQFLDVCLLRDDQNKPYIVISANLKHTFRQQIAKEMIRIINYDTLSHSSEINSRVESLV